ncbi:MAG: acyltransferase [Acetobacteraceae bacterium]|nr:acyltransferase [Acetobacteraceae bacterium]
MTGLRGLAALGVTVFHYYADLDTGLTDPLHMAVRRGYLLVDLFFVLSGFVMAMTYGAGFLAAPGFATWRGFMLRRAARIVPLYLVALIGCLALAYLAYGRFSSSFGGFPVAVDRPLLEIPANLLLVQSWSLTQSALVPAWSISTEWAAYLLFPAFVALVLGGGWRRAALGCAMACAMLAAAAWITAHDGLEHAGPLDASAGQVPGALLRCFGGFVLGMGVYRLSSWGPAAVAFGDGFGALLFGALLLVWLFAPHDHLVYPLLPLVVLCAAGNRGRIARLLSAKPLYMLGVLSYAVYLLHYQLAGVIHWVEKALAAAGLPAVAYYPLAAALVYGVLLVAAAASHRFVEVPGRRLVRSIEGRRARAEPAAAGA